MLNKWLSAGYIEKGTFYKTSEGTPQGGVISPKLATITLNGLENTVKTGVHKSDKVNVIVYADDFIITGNSKEILEKQVKPRVVKFLKERDLELSEKKTQIIHIDDGFDFLGFNARKYNDILLIKPSKENIKSFLYDIYKYYKIQSNSNH